MHGASWASDMESNQSLGFQYAERDPSKPPSSNVVLGSPNHKGSSLAVRLRKHADLVAPNGTNCYVLEGKRGRSNSAVTVHH